ncbi:MAG: hypothetical protein ACI8P2_002038, partial [Candidatus Latescibacterota bacterium]
DLTVKFFFTSAIVWTGKPKEKKISDLEVKNCRVLVA